MAGSRNEIRSSTWKSFCDTFYSLHRFKMLFAAADRRSAASLRQSRNRTTLMNRRPSFTLVELLVVIAIIGVLGSLLLPAVQRVREAARRTQCQNNLRQLGYALHNLYDANEAFPASVWTTSGPGNPKGKFVGWRPLTLPYIEEETVQALYDFDVNWWEGTNPAAGSVHVSTYLCPSTPSRIEVMSIAAKPPRPAMTFDLPLAPTDYEAIIGVREVLDPTRYTSENRFSVMHRNSRVTAARVRDGMSRTIMVVECAGRPRTYRGRSAAPAIPNDQGLGWVDSEGPFSLDGASADGLLEGCGLEGGCRHAMNMKNDNEPYSFHSGASNVLFADAHVQFVSQQVDILVFAALCTRAAGEIVSDVDY